MRVVCSWSKKDYIRDLWSEEVTYYLFLHWYYRGDPKLTLLLHSCRYDSEHTCATQFRQGEHPQATSTFVGETMKHRYIDPSCSPCKPKDIMSYMQQDFGVDMSYKKAWRSRQAALSSLFGTDDASYRSLPKFMYMWSTNNPGSSFDLVTTPRSHRFKYLFMSLVLGKGGGSIYGP